MVQHPGGNRRRAGREFAFNRSRPGIGSYTWRYVFDPIPSATATRLTESYDAERPLPKLMVWLTEKWTGSPDRDADLSRGMEVTLSRFKAAAEKH